MDRLDSPLEGHLESLGLLALLAGPPEGALHAWRTDRIAGRPLHTLEWLIRSAQTSRDVVHVHGFVGGDDVFNAICAVQDLPEQAAPLSPPEPDIWARAEQVMLDLIDKGLPDTTHIPYLPLPLRTRMPYVDSRLRYQIDRYTRALMTGMQARGYDITEDVTQAPTPSGFQLTATIRSSAGSRFFPMIYTTDGLLCPTSASGAQHAPATLRDLRDVARQVSAERTA